MPAKSLSPCTYPGCSVLVKGGRCSKHQTWRDKQRGSAAARGYDRKWRKLRDSVLAQEPLCRKCAKQGKTVPATDVDHIVALKHGGSNSSRNLQPLCHKCHAEKTFTGS